MTKDKKPESEQNNSTKPVQTPAQMNIQVDLDEVIAQGSYANMAITNFSPEEFITDFVFLQPNVPKARVRARVILSPRNAKRFADSLIKNIQAYENKFGPIAEGPQAPGIQLSIN